MKPKILTIEPSSEAPMALQSSPVTTIKTSCDEPCIQAPMLVTPISACHRSAMAVTPDSTIDDDVAGIQTPESLRPQEDNSVNEELERVRCEAKQLADTLDLLAGGIRCAKRIMEKSVSDPVKESTEVADYQGEIHEISTKLHGVLGSDLLGLINATNMVRGHAKLAAEEATVLVEDVRKSNQEIEKLEVRKSQVEKISRKLYKENLTLQQDVAKMRKERRALVKEVKSLREQVDETKRFDSWRLLEKHLMDSIALHEQVMRTPTGNAGATHSFDEVEASNEWETDAVEAPSESEVIGSHGRGRQGTLTSPVVKNEDETTKDANASISPKKNRGGLSTFKGAVSGGFRMRYGRKNASPSYQEARAQLAPAPDDALKLTLPFQRSNQSPLPSLGEATECCTEDSWTEATVALATKPDQTASPEADKLAMPQDIVSFDVPKGTEMPTHFASPLISPDGSPSGLPPLDLRPICDPHILRTLALPSSREDTVIHYKDPSPRKQVGPGLYEC